MKDFIAVFLLVVGSIGFLAGTLLYLSNLALLDRYNFACGVNAFMHIDRDYCR